MSYCSVMYVWVRIIAVNKVVMSAIRVKKFDPSTIKESRAKIDVYATSVLAHVVTTCSAIEDEYVQRQVRP